MAEPTIYDGIRFYESTPARSRVIGPVEVELGGLFTEAQLRTLNDVKRELARLAKNRGGNSIINFKYGQASGGFWKSILQLDDVNWYGRGEVASVAD